MMRRKDKWLAALLAFSSHAAIAVAAWQHNDGLAGQADAATQPGHTIAESQKLLFNLPTLVTPVAAEVPPVAPVLPPPAIKPAPVKPHRQPDVTVAVATRAIEEEQDQPQEEQHQQQEAPVPATPIQPPRPPAVTQSGSPHQGPEGMHGHSHIEHEWDAYKRTIFKTITANQIYPRQARMRHEEGRIEVAFHIRKDGQIDHFKIVHPCHSQRLNESAEQLFGQLQLPPPPGAVVERLPTDMTVSLDYNLHKHKRDDFSHRG